MPKCMIFDLKEKTVCQGHYLIPVGGEERVRDSEYVRTEEKLSYPTDLSCISSCVFYLESILVRVLPYQEKEDLEPVVVEVVSPLPLVQVDDPPPSQLISTKTNGQFKMPNKLKNKATL